MQALQPVAMTRKGIVSRLRQWGQRILLAVIFRTGVFTEALAQQSRKARKKIARKNAIASRKVKQNISSRRDVKALSAERKKIRTLLAGGSGSWSPEQRVFLLQALASVGSVSAEDVDALLNNLFAQREMDLVELILNENSFGFELVADYYRLRLQAFRQDNVPLHDIVNLRRRAKGSLLQGRLSQDYLIAAVKLGAVEDVKLALSELSGRELSRVRRATIMGIARLYIRDKLYSDAEQLLRRYIPPERTDQDLYFLEVLSQLRDMGRLSGALLEFCNLFAPVSSIGVIDFLERTYKAADESDRRNLKKFIIQPLSQLSRHAENLMDIRFSPEQKQTLLERIRAAVAEQRPLSLLRLGDGEAYAYPAIKADGVDPQLFDLDNRAFERRWWGKAPPVAIREKITAGVRKAVARCDILGLPSVYRIIRDLPRPYSAYGSNRNQRSYMRLFGAVGDLIAYENKIFTEERCQRCAIDAAFLVDLAAMARSVVIVSCWPDLHAKFPGADVEIIQIPPVNYLKNAETVYPFQPFFEVYPETGRRMQSFSGPGTVVYVGAGLIGKILVDEARQAGAVALDVGSLLDYMAGLKTRTVADVI